MFVLLFERFKKSMGCYQVMLAMLGINDLLFSASLSF